MSICFCSRPDRNCEKCRKNIVLPKDEEVTKLLDKQGGSVI